MKRTYPHFWIVRNVEQSLNKFTNTTFIKTPFLSKPFFCMVAPLGRSLIAKAITTMSSFIVVGIKSYKDLSSAFVTTLLAGGDSISNRPAVTCGVPHGSSTTTYFYLDPFDSDSRGNSSCVGTDLVGELVGGDVHFLYRYTFIDIPQ